MYFLKEQFYLNKKEDFFACLYNSLLLDQAA